MGRALVLKRVVLLFFMMAGATKVQAVEDNNSATPPFGLDQNKTLDAAYQNVQMQIERTMKERASLTQVTPKITNIEHNITPTPSHDVNVTVIEKKPRVVAPSLPKLVIIMDDVAICEHADRIKKLPFSITPSIFPPTKYFPKTPMIAKRFKYHMVHFPMEAQVYKNRKEGAISVGDDAQMLERKIKQIKHLFPKAVALNNHTGSKYTCDFGAMSRFFTVLDKYKIPFIDSLTSADSKCQEVARQRHQKILQRDVFLDNVPNVSSIKEQLKIAVETAKKNGKAIAICHPKDETFEALMDAKSILEGIDVVYINALL